MTKYIVVSGYPKSGTTWATRQVAELLDCPAKGYWGFAGKTLVTEGEERASEYMCYQFHGLHEEIMQSGLSKPYKVIYIVRDPRDVVVSGMFHFSFLHDIAHRLVQSTNVGAVKSLVRRISSSLISLRAKQHRMVKIVTGGDDRLESCKHSWSAHVESYMDQPALIIRYEDLLADSLETSLSILRYVGVDKSIDEVRRGIDAQAFNKRKRTFLRDDETVRYQHLRKGVSGDWVNHISQETNRYIIDSLGNHMRRYGYE